MEETCARPSLCTEPCLTSSWGSILSQKKGFRGARKLAVQGKNLV